MASIEEIRKEWSRITDILPDLNKIGAPSILGLSSEEFRETYSDNVSPQIERECFERILSLLDFHPDIVEKYKQRLAELDQI